MPKKLLVTGSSGLIGSEVVQYFCNLGWNVDGIDNNMRATLFGPAGSTRANQQRLEESHHNFSHHEIDIRNLESVNKCVQSVRPDAIVHCAAQPSHDLAASQPLDDFSINANGTHFLLEAARRYAPDAVFVHMSTNKVYGDGPNRLGLEELPTRWDFLPPSTGIAEDFPVDQCLHSLFGVSKLAGDVLVQEYGRYFGMKTCCLRGGCLTGPNHAGVELHGFLNYLIRCNVAGKTYRVYGYKGKQVRDNIHALDVARFIHAFIEKPRVAEVYNIGGGRSNSVSILEAFDRAESVSGKKMIWEYVDQARIGDHICYISDLSKMRSHYPEWCITKSLDDIFDETFRATAGAAA